MNSLIDRLKKYNQDIKLEERFVYNFDNINPTIFSDREKIELKKDRNSFKQNVILKELIKEKANGSYSLTDLNFWIIKDWGKLNFKKNDKNVNKIEAYSQQLIRRKLTRATFETISSLSKISSFIDPDNYVIYDSRVIYSINWLILTSKPSELKFFPMPPPRNRKLMNFDLNTIIRLANKSTPTYTFNAELFYDYKIAYFMFCDLIKSLSKSLFDDPTIKPYHLEMLLFVIADKEIYNELTEWTNIEIKP